MIDRWRRDLSHRPIHNATNYQELSASAATRVASVGLGLRLRLLQQRVSIPNDRLPEKVIRR